MITNSHVGILPLHQSLTNRAKQVQVLPKLTNSSLLSIGQLCDDNCAALFRKHDLHVFKYNKLVLKGVRNYCDGLWDVPLPQYENIRGDQQRQQKINVIVPKNQTQYQLSNFYQ